MSDAAHHEISFQVTPEERRLISKLAARAVEMERKYAADSYSKPRRKIDFEMDLCACIANGNPLRLADLLSADDFNFAHDVFGIARHLSHETGKLEGFFSPRFSRRDARVEA